MLKKEIHIFDNAKFTESRMNIRNQDALSMKNLDVPYKGHEGIVKISVFQRNNYTYDINKIVNPEFNIYTIFKEIKERILSNEDRLERLLSVAISPELRKFKDILDGINYSMFSQMLKNGAFNDALNYQQNERTIIINGEIYKINFKGDDTLEDLVNSYQILYNMISNISTFNDNKFNKNNSIIIYCELDDDNNIDLNGYIEVKDFYNDVTAIRSSIRYEKYNTTWYAVKDIQSYIEISHNKEDSSVRKYFSGRFLYEKNEDVVYMYFDRTEGKLRGNDAMKKVISNQYKRDDIIYQGVLGRLHHEALYNKLCNRLLDTKKLADLLTPEVKVKLDAYIMKYNTLYSDVGTSMTNEIKRLLSDPKSFIDANHQVLVFDGNYARFMVVKGKPKSIKGYKNILACHSMLTNNSNEHIGENKGYMVRLENVHDNTFIPDISDENGIIAVPNNLDHCNSLIEFAEKKIGGDFYALTRYPGINLM